MAYTHKVIFITSYFKCAWGFSSPFLIPTPLPHFLPSLPSQQPVVTTWYTLSYLSQCSYNHMPMKLCNLHLCALFVFTECIPDQLKHRLLIFLLAKYPKARMSKLQSMDQIHPATFFL